MNKEAFLNKIAETFANGNVESKLLFRVKTVPTVEGFSNIGFDGLQELCDMYRKVAKQCDAEGEAKLAAQGRVDANRCEKLIDKWNGMSTIKVDTETVVKECTDLLAELYPGHVFMAGQGCDDDGMFFDFKLGPLVSEVVDKMIPEADTDSEFCPCPACAAERERHAQGIPTDQLN